MPHSTKQARLSSAVLAGLLPLLATAPASAGKGFILYGHGDHIADRDEIPREIAAELPAEFSGARIGYMYGYFDIFYLNVFTWDGKPVIYSGDTYWDLDEESLEGLRAAGAGSALEAPWSYKIPPGAVILVVGIGLWILASRNKTAS